MNNYVHILAFLYTLYILAHVMYHASSIVLYNFISYIMQTKTCFTSSLLSEVHRTLAVAHKEDLSSPLSQYNSIITGLLDLYKNVCSPSDSMDIMKLMSDHFGADVMNEHNPTREEGLLLLAVEDELNERHLQRTTSFIDKVPGHCTTQGIGSLMFVGVAVAQSTSASAMCYTSWAPWLRQDNLLQDACCCIQQQLHL